MDFQFPGCATYKPGIMEWTTYILAEIEGTLRQASIFGAVGVSQFPITSIVMYGELFASFGGR